MHLVKRAHPDWSYLKMRQKTRGLTKQVSCLICPCICPITMLSLLETNMTSHFEMTRWTSQ